MNALPRARRFPRALSIVAALLGCGGAGVWACAFDDTLREYLDTHFWLPMGRSGRHFTRGAGAVSNSPYAGMGTAEGASPLARVRAAYQSAERCQVPATLFADTRAQAGLTRREREEVDLIEAKVAMRCGSAEQPETLRAAMDKFKRFVATARDPLLKSEARGWIAHIHYSLGDQTAAGKIYLDELNRAGSNLSRETILNSIRLTYGYTGGAKLLEHLDEYFDTPEHAVFAIHLVTNPRWERRQYYEEGPVGPDVLARPPYERIKGLLERHRALFRSAEGAQMLAALGMRTALRAGDPAAALRIASEVPAAAPVRRDPDFLWMLASARYLSRQYASAEAPLLQMFNQRGVDRGYRHAAAYALCGVYQKTGDFVEQLRYALWLHSHAQDQDEEGGTLNYPGVLADQSVYWAFSGFDLALLLDTEAPVEALRTFLERYPGAGHIQLVQYSLAVRLARADQYEEAAEIYRALKVNHRAKRMDDLGALHRAAFQSGGGPEAKFKLAEYLAGHPDQLYFNARLWSGLQRYALYADRDTRLNGAERTRLAAGERKLKDEQEERWRAHLLLREVVNEAGPGELGRRAARLAIRCVRRLNGRFERAGEIRQADIDLTIWLARNNRK